MKFRNKSIGYLLYSMYFLCFFLTQVLFYYYIGGSGRVQGLSYIFITTTVIIALSTLTRSRAVVYTVLGCLTLLLYANVIYYRTYLSLIPIDSFRVKWSDLFMVRMSIVQSMRWVDVFLFLPLLVTVVVEWLITRNKTFSKKGFWRAALCNLGMAAVLGCIVILPKYQLLQDDYNNRFYLDRVKGAHGFTYYAYLYNDYSNRPKDISLTKDDLVQINHYLAKNESRMDTVCRNENRNVILLLVESLESFPLNIELEGHEITPFLNAMQNDTLSLYVPRIVTQIGGGRSIDGQLLVNTGLLPLNHGVAAFMSDRKYISLASLIKQEDPQTESLTLQPLSPSFWNQSLFSEMLSYDRTISGPDFKQEDLIDDFISDKSLIKQSVEMLKKQQNPFFAQIITMTSHDAVDIGDRKRFTISDSIDHDIARYLEIINYVDGAIELLFSELREAGMLENTTIIITGDHNKFNRNDFDEKTASLMDSEYNYIPLIIYNSNKSGRYDEVIGQVDIFPTILDALKIQSEWRGLGTSVFAPNPPTAAVTKSMQAVGIIDSTTEQRMKEAWRISDLMIKGNYFKLVTRDE